MLNMEEYQNDEDARSFIREMTGSTPTNEPNNKASNTLTIQPFNRFTGAQGMATIMVDLDETTDRDGTKLYRASSMNGWSYVALDTQIIDGKAVAQTDQGGIFVAAAEISTGTIVGVVVALVVVLLVVILVIGLSIYFFSKPEKWRATKDRLVQTQNRVKRSFAKQV